MGLQKKSNRLFMFLLFFIGLCYGLPICFKIDQFPFTNYPMYSKKIKDRQKIFFLCNSENKVAYQILRPLRSQTVWHIMKKNHISPDPAHLSLYFKTLSMWNQKFTDNPHSQLRFVKFFLNLASYETFLLTTDSEEKNSLSTMFAVCDANPA